MKAVNPKIKEAVIVEGRGDDTAAAREEWTVTPFETHGFGRQSPHLKSSKNI